MPEKSGHSDRKRRHKSRDRSRSPFSEETTSRRKDKRSRRHAVEEAEPNHAGGDVSIPTGASGDVSLSISETNALRAKLGLAPLRAEGETSADPNKPVDNQSENYVHAPAKDLKKIRQEESLKEKLSVQKDKRTLYEKLSGARLYEPEETETSVSSWVDKIREKERIKRQAQERAKLLSEMDEQLEVTFTHPTSNTTYDSSNLTGLRVEHKSDVFKEGKSVILTLKDKDVLANDDEGDVLVNPNIVDDEKAQINRENLRKMAGLAGIADQEDEDVLLGLRAKTILSKYDTEIEGNRKSQFVIGSEGTYVPENERALEQLRAELSTGKISLPDTELRIASEYYSVEEMQAKFKKRTRRVKKTRTKSALTADDLADSSVGDAGTDLGSRATRSDHPPDTVETELGEIEVPNQELPSTSYDANDDLSELSKVIIEEDEWRGELEKTIGRVLRAKSSVYVKPEEFIAQSLAQKQEQPQPVPELTPNSNKVVFDATAEFYKSIGTGLQESMRQHSRLGRVKPEPSDDELDHLKAEPGEIRKQESPEGMSMSEESDNDYADQRRHKSENHTPFPGTASEAKKKEQKLAGVLDDEPVLDHGVFSALRLAEKKGYLEKGKEKRTGAGTMVNLMAKNFVEEEVRYDDIDAKFMKRDRYSGPLSEFKELRQYKPDVKLEYVDELGRQLNAKEAFRQLSHKFHGKGSGKNKTEKRMKKIKEEFLLKASTSSDTPLGTAAKLNKKLQSISQPYVILSGKNAAVKNLTK